MPTTDIRTAPQTLAERLRSRYASPVELRPSGLLVDQPTRGAATLIPNDKHLRLAVQSQISGLVSDIRIALKAGRLLMASYCQCCYL